MAESKALEAVKFLEQRLRDTGLRVSRVVLFGSQARCDATQDSDVDVAIVSEDFRGKDIFERAQMTKAPEIEATRKFLVPFDIVTLTPEELENGTALVARFAKAGTAV